MVSHFCLLLKLASFSVCIISLRLNSGICYSYEGFPHSSVGKESTCNAGDPGLIPGSGRFPGEGIDLHIPVFLGFPGGSTGKEYACNAGNLVLISGLGRPWRRERLPSSVFWLGEFHGLQSRGCLNTTEKLSLST